jgi:hypothetical protein
MKTRISYKDRMGDNKVIALHFLGTQHLIDFDNLASLVLPLKCNGRCKIHLK